MPHCWQKYTKALFIGAFLFWALIYQCPRGFSDPAQSFCQQRELDETAIVAKIYDGDTIRLADDRVVRLIGINTPELAREGKPPQPLAGQAKAALLSLLPIGTRVGLVYGQERHDHYQRTLAHVYGLTGKNVAAELIMRGLGFAIVVPPNTGLTHCYFDSEEQARKAGHGIWSNPAYTPKNVNSLTQSDTGFQYVIGKVTGIGHGKKNIWLDMGEAFSVRVQTKYLENFAQLPLETLSGRHLRLRGWVAFYNHKLRMNIGHPAMLEIVD